MPLSAAGLTRLSEDIRGLIKGDVQCDEIAQQLYSTDASILQVRPACVVHPRNTDDVVAVARYAHEAGISLHPRGAGTSLTGESLGEGIVIVCSQYMRRLLKTGSDYVTIQPGILRRRLNMIIGQSQGRLFGPLAGNVSSASLGSILARNGAGIHYLRYGLPSDHLMSLTVVLANGDVLTLDRNALIQPMLATTGGAENVELAQEIAYGKEYVYAGKIAQLLQNRTSQQLAESTNQIAVNRSGYAVQSVMQASVKQPMSVPQVDLARLFSGSEGSLGIFVEATVKTVARPNRKIAAVFFFSSIFSAFDAVSAISPLRPVLCELVDRRRLKMIRDWDTRYCTLIPQDAEAALLVELDSGTEDQPISQGDCQHNLKNLIDLIQTKLQLSFHSLRIQSEQDSQLFDHIIRRSELVLGRMHQSIQPIPLFDDIGLPMDAFHRAVGDLLTLFQRHKVTVSLSGHVGQGHIRVHPLLDLGEPKIISVLSSLAEKVYETVWQYGGTVSSEWGTGRLKSQFLPQQFPHSMSLYRQIKEIFDPLYLLSPGNVIPLGQSWTQCLRHGLGKRSQESAINGEAGHLSEYTDWPSSSFVPGLSGIHSVDAVKSPAVGVPSDLSSELSIGNQPIPASTPSGQNQIESQLKWDPSYVFEPTYRCKGCGECLRFDRQSRMCPLFRGTARIEFTPRSKADLMRGVLEQDIELASLTSDRAKEVAGTCFHCRMCDIECPSNVDITLLAFRSKAAYIAAHGLPLQDLVFSRLDKVFNFLTPVSCLFNTAMKNRIVRWLIEKALNIPQSRMIPTLSPRSYLQRTRWPVSKMRSPSPGIDQVDRQADKPDLKRIDRPKAALFLDTYTNYCEPQLAELALRILEHNGIAVHIPARQRPSGRTSIAVGHASQAERLARRNTAQLSELIRQGYKIVTIEPHSASCLTRDYRYLIDTEEVDLLSGNVVDFCAFLLQHHREGKLQRDFQPLLYQVGYHAPCCGISLSSSLTVDMMPTERILRLIPGLGIERIEQGCCGMGGLWGFNQKNYRHSLNIGMPLFRTLRLPEIDFGVSECMSCCSQMSHGSKKPAVHPIRLLAVAYDFLPANTLLK